MKTSALFSNLPARVSSVAFVALAVACGASARGAAFVQDGQLIVADEASSQIISLASPGARAAVGAIPEVSAFWGEMNDGRLLVTLKNQHEHAHEHLRAGLLPSDGGDLNNAEVEVDAHCSTETLGEAAVLIDAASQRQAAVFDNVLRAYPAPAKNRIAVISPERDLLLWDNDVVTTVTAPGRVSNLGWSPDGERFVASVYPPDWSEGAVSSALTTVEFLRLQNADLYLYDVEQGKFVSQLTDDPGTEYGAFFSQDGSLLYFVWLHISNGDGGLMRMSLDVDDRTSASAPAVQLTRAGEDAGETPLGRVTTYRWTPGGHQLVFEAGRPDGSGVIWTMAADGGAAKSLEPGRKPQMLPNGDLVFQGSRGITRIAVPEVQP